MPGVQKPHCEPCSIDHGLLQRMQVVAVGEVLDRDELRPVDLAEQQNAGVDGLVGERCRRADAPRTTVQAPQSPSAQPSLVPFAPASSRSQSRSIARGENRSSATSRAAKPEAQAFVEPLPGLPSDRILVSSGPPPIIGAFRGETEARGIGEVEAAARSAGRLRPSPANPAARPRRQRGDRFLHAHRRLGVRAEAAQRDCSVARPPCGRERSEPEPSPASARAPCN